MSNAHYEELEAERETAVFVVELSLKKWAKAEALVQDLKEQLRTARTDSEYALGILEANQQVLHDISVDKAVEERYNGK